MWPALLVFPCLLLVVAIIASRPVVIVATPPHAHALRYRPLLVRLATNFVQLSSALSLLLQLHQPESLLLLVERDGLIALLRGLLTRRELHLLLLSLLLLHHLVVDALLGVHVVLAQKILRRLRQVEDHLPAHELFDLCAQLLLELCELLLFQPDDRQHRERQRRLAVRVVRAESNHQVDLGHAWHTNEAMR